MPPPNFGLRDTIKALSPPWLRNGVDERKMYGFGLGCDALLDKLTQGVLDRFPTRADPSALPLLSSDRQLPRGLTESDTSFAARLQRVFDSDQLAGTARATLSQLLGFLLQTTPLVRSVSSRYQADPARVQLQLAQTLGFGITAATNATPIVVTTGIDHGLSNGDDVTITGALGNTGANGEWVIASATALGFTLVGSIGNGAYNGGGRVILTSAIPDNAYPPARLSSMWNSYPISRSSDAEPIPELVLSGGGNWDWDSVSQVGDSWTWWGAFLMLSSVAPNNWTDKGAKWGTGVKWGSGPAWGVTTVPGVGLSILIIARQFKAAQSVIRGVIVTFDNALFDPEQPANGVDNPAGDFGHWSKIVNGAYVPARFANARYGAGVI